MPPTQKHALLCTTPKDISIKKSQRTCGSVDHLGFLKSYLLSVMDLKSCLSVLPVKGVVPVKRAKVRTPIAHMSTSGPYGTSSKDEEEEEVIEERK